MSAPLAGRLVQAANECCTPQRLDNAISKLGRVKRTDKKRRDILRSDFVDDVLAELAASYANEWKRIPQKERDALRNHIEAQAEALIEARLT